MRRLIACLLVCLLVSLSVCSPVMAVGTTDSEYDIMPLSALSGNLSISLGGYSFTSDTFSFGVTTSVSDVAVAENSPRRFLTYSGTYDSSNPYLGMRFALSDISLSKDQSMSLIFNRLIFYCSIPTLSIYKGFDLTTLAPVRAYASVTWSGTGKQLDTDNNTFISLNGTRSLPLDVAFQNASTAYLSNGGTGSNFTNFSCADLTLSFTFTVPDTVTVNGTRYEVVSGTVTAANLYVAFPFSSQNFNLFPSVIFTDQKINITPVASYAGGQPAYYMVLQNSSSDFAASNFASLNQSLGNLSNNLTNKINDVKITVQQGTAEIKQSVQQGANQVVDSLQSQTQSLTDKLTDVKDGIVQGIIDLKDATTQGFTDVVQGITDLPGKIGEMLTGLIVPDEQKVSDKFSNFRDLAEEKLGVIYQVPEMMFSMANSIVSGAVEQKGEMTLPKFEIIMPATNQSRAGERLTVWEEYTFQIWPEGTEVIHTAVQTATSMICVILTFNALKRKYDDWLDGK